jgi:hypothetical protein
MSTDIQFTIPPRPFYTIPLFYKPAEWNPGKNWVHLYLSWPRSFQEWMLFLGVMKAGVFVSPKFKAAFTFDAIPSPPYIPNTIPDPWYHRDIATEQMIECFYTNQRIRWCFKRLFLGIRRRIMKRRIVGECDVGTMEPIPAHFLVQVHDWHTRAIYHFHAQTLHKEIARALRYQSYAIAAPKIPKNPYTNLPWTRSQLSVLVPQIQQCLWLHGVRFVDRIVQAFHICEYDIAKFRKVCGHQLQVDSARRFFMDASSDGWDVLYEESLEDLFIMVKPIGSLAVQRLIVDRALPVDILKEWDELVLEYWCYENLNTFIGQGRCSIFELVECGKRLLDRTDTYIAERKKARNKKKRIVS